MSNLDHIYKFAYLLICLLTYLFDHFVFSFNYGSKSIYKCTYRLVIL